MAQSRWSFGVDPPCIHMGLVDEKGQKGKGDCEGIRAEAKRQKNLPPLTVTEMMIPFRGIIVVKSNYYYCTEYYVRLKGCCSVLSIGNVLQCITFQCYHPYQTYMYGTVLSCYSDMPTV